MSKIHELKILPEFFEHVLFEIKRFEIRKEDDKFFNVGDYLHLKEYSPNLGYSGRNCTVLVMYCLRGLPYVPDGYVCMSIALKSDND